MAKISSTVKLDDAATLRLPGIMNKATRKAVRAAGMVVVRRTKQLVPQPGYPGDKPEFKALRDTIGVEVKEGRQWFAVVGPKYPAGAHGHLVEFGHEPSGWYAKQDGAGFVKGTPFLEPAAKETLAKQKQVIEAALNKAINGAG